MRAIVVLELVASKRVAWGRRPARCWTSRIHFVVVLVCEEGWSVYCLRRVMRYER